MPVQHQMHMHHQPHGHVQQVQQVQVVPNPEVEVTEVPVAAAVAGVVQKSALKKSVSAQPAVQQQNTNSRVTNMPNIALNTLSSSSSAMLEQDEDVQAQAQHARDASSGSVAKVDLVALAADTDMSKAKDAVGARHHQRI